MILKERLKEIPEDYYVWNIDDEHWQDRQYLTEEELQSDDSEWHFILAELLLSDAHGQYIPKVFYESFDLEKWNIKAEDCQELSDPENELYWDAWQELLNDAYCINNDKKYTLYQNSDLYAVCFME